MVPCRDGAIAGTSCIMILHLSNVLARDDVYRVIASLDREAFVDGQQTVGRVVRRIKNNLELPVDSPLRGQLSAQLAKALWRRADFREGAMPRTMSAFLFSRYRPGMAYGDHIDDPIMGEGGEPFRSDLSVTVFLNEPDAYDGGELIIDSDGAGQEVKLPAGDAVVYPTTSIHRVDPVTRGERRVAVGWIQSMVRDPAKRQMTWDMLQVLDGLARQERGEPAGDVDAYRLLQKCRANLIRMWAEV